MKDSTASAAPANGNFQPPAYSPQVQSNGMIYNPPQPTIVYYNAQPQHLAQHTSNQNVDNGASATANNILRFNGLLGFGCLVVSVILSSYVGSGPQIGSIVGGLACFIAGLCASCCCAPTQASNQTRAAIVIFFSLLAFACSVSAFRLYGTLEACVTEASSYGVFDYYGDSAYFVEAAECAIDSASWTNCNCVNGYDQCFLFTVTDSCNNILGSAPKLSKALLAVGIMLFITSLISLCAAIRSARDERMAPLNESIINNPVITTQYVATTPQGNPVYVAQPIVAVPVYN